MAFDESFYEFREQMRRWDERNALDYAVEQATERLRKEIFRAYARNRKLSGWQL